MENQFKGHPFLNHCTTSFHVKWQWERFQKDRQKRAWREKKKSIYDCVCRNIFFDAVPLAFGMFELAEYDLSTASDMNILEVVSGLQISSRSGNCLWTINEQFIFSYSHPVLIQPIKIHLNSSLCKKQLLTTCLFITWKIISSWEGYIRYVCQSDSYHIHRDVVRHVKKEISAPWQHKVPCQEVRG